MNIYYYIMSDPSSPIQLYNYCGGAIVIAANSEEEAKQLIRDTPYVYMDFNGKYRRPAYNIDLIYKIEGASIDRDLPEILINEGHDE